MAKIIGIITAIVVIVLLVAADTKIKISVKIGGGKKGNKKSHLQDNKKSTNDN